jgi:hypothetical protein
MTSIVRVVETEALQGCEVSFDSIEPTCICRCRNQGHAMISGILNQCLFSVRGEIIENKVYPSRFGVACTEAFPRLKNISGGLPFVHNTLQDIALDIVECKELLCACFLGVCCSDALRMTSPRPADTRDRSKFHWSKLVKTDHCTVRRSFVIEFQNTVFFTSNSGSGDSFQVFVR